jgi:hypothetical protein
VSLQTHHEAVDEKAKEDCSRGTSRSNVRVVLRGAQLPVRLNHTDGSDQQNGDGRDPRWHPNKAGYQSGRAD